MTDPKAPASTPASERQIVGRGARRNASRSSHARWTTWPDRPDPIAILQAQEERRWAELIPIRHGRMATSPFAFFRGAAAVMAADLAPTPRSGLIAQLCGDAHLVNFGVFSAPDRSLVFDANDFDETLPGPWEFDVKRLAASFEVAMRNRGLDAASRRDAVLSAVRAYRNAMAEFAEMRAIDVWYSRQDANAMLEALQTRADAKSAKTVVKGLAKASAKDSLRALTKLTTTVDGMPRIISRPPLIVPAEELLTAEELPRFEAVIAEFLGNYRASLPPDRRRLIDNYEFEQIARKVVGVGSVGMRSWIVLMLGRDSGDPLFLQLKQAEASVLEPYVGRSRYRNHGRRVVEGQRLMQASTDVLLGWYRVRAFDGLEHDFYVRQLWDGKATIDVAGMRAGLFGPYAEACGWALARGHARTGDPVAISAYLGKSDAFDRAIAVFAATYAERNEQDYESFVAAIKDGRLQAQMGV